MTLDALSRAWGMALPSDRSAGLQAYARYHMLMHDIAQFYGLPMWHVTAAFVALSPNNDYIGNLRSLLSVLNGIVSGMDRARVTVSTYKSCRDRAWDYATGVQNILVAGRGMKTRSFYKNIMDPGDPEPVTIDGHCVSAWIGKRMTMKEVVTQRWVYGEVAGAYRALAQVTGLLPNQVQATIWFTWKRIHRVLYSDQLSLFDASDGVTMDWRRLRGYPLTP